MEDCKIDQIEDIAMEERFNVLVEVSEEIFHDFKNTLAMISGLAQLTALENVSEEAKKNLNTINNTSLEGRKVLDRFYNLIEGSNVEGNNNLSLANIIFQILDMIRHRINNSEKNKEIKLNLNLNSTRKIYCNEHKMRQAILNIILNALDAMEDRGGILGIALYQNEGTIILEISDTGIGIPEENLERIFKSNFTTKGKDGTGLGLRISKDIIEEYGGEVFVESRIGWGSKFTVKFPIR